MSRLAFFNSQHQRRQVGNIFFPHQPGQTAHNQVLFTFTQQNTAGLFQKLSKALVIKSADFLGLLHVGLAEKV